MRRLLPRLLPRLLASLAILLVLLLHVAGTVPIRIIDRIENFAYDMRLNYTMPRQADHRVIIVDIDERSLRREGQWPWSRNKLKNLTDALFDRYQVAVLGFDIVFAERDESFEMQELERLAKANADETFLRQLEEFEPLLDRDKLFADSLSGRPVILGYYFNINPQKTESTGQLPHPVFVDDDFMSRTLFAPKASSFGANLAILQSNAISAGFFSNPLVDSDGIVRRVPMLHEFEGALYESFPLAVARQYLDAVAEPVLAADTEVTEGYPALEALNVGPAYIPIDANGGALVPYRGKKGSFLYVSASDVLNQEIGDPQVLHSAIALVGTTALGIVDLRATPFQPVYPGIEIHASVISGILDEAFRHRPAWAWGAEIAIVAIVGLIMASISPLLGPLAISAFGIFILAMVLGLNLYLWEYARLVVPLATSVLLIGAVCMANITFGFFAEFRAKRQIRNAFSHYLAPELVQQLEDDPARLRLEGESRELTSLFSDIAGFTTFVEKTDAEIVVRLLNEYLDGMCRIVMLHGGIIDKIVGDAVHAIFNAPMDQENHAARAVDCALAMDEFSNEFIAENHKEGIDLGITRVGVNTGLAVIGNFGGSERFDYTAYGDTINTAARLESVNKYLGTRICVAGATVNKCPDLHFRPIGSLTLQGKSQAVDAYEPLTSEQVRSERIGDYLAAFESLKNQAPTAEKAFRELASRYPEDPVIALHTRRLANGETGIHMAMTEK